ncbi:M20/M25/M40 family metallo-hydrolase [Pseudomonas poae]|uniref:M20/M25/M40 family metallo-hydrolase n=1 Tax=Pseudomonas poae TaxID=200451 RepID=UPI003BAF4C67
MHPGFRGAQPAGRQPGPVSGTTARARRSDRAGGEKLSSVAAIEIETVNTYPGLDTHPSVEAVRFLKQFAAPDTGTAKVSFGTEGGLFKQRLDVPVVVCGPGSIEQAHKPDEFIEISQMDAGEAFLHGLLGSLKA